MASLFHIIFEFIRIGILSLIYGFLIWLVLNKVFKTKNLKKRLIIPLIFIGLFVWRNSYWRNNGYGDFGRVPLTSEYEITMIDFWIASIKKNGENLNLDGNTNSIEKLYFEKNILYGKTEEKYLIFDTENEKLDSDLDEIKFTKLNGKLEKLKDPDVFHSDYWSWKILIF